ncbi:putative ubiquitin-conjugating enzyme E2-16 kDa, partial [Ilyonectria robusta]|uniref:putative ubiquitin-conjugating enzyme E2-16 kDa n=1 Tax=Ilyonectria robusta TaxID=1079257 RepID=UPI001E8D676F
FRPLHAKFTTRVYHPNIDHTGAISLDILGTEGSSILNFEHVLLSICSFLDDPSPDKLLVLEIAYNFKTDRARL